MGLALVPFVVLGLARFNYGLLLPAMRADLGWSYTEAGLVTTANAIGYLLGAMSSRRASQRWGLAGSLLGGLWGTAGSLLANGLLDDYWVIILARLAAGAFGGIAFVAGGVLATHLSSGAARWALAVYPVGAGAAIAVSALVLPGLAAPPSRWPVGWFSMAGLTVLVATLMTLLLRHHPLTFPSQGPTSTAGLDRLRRRVVAYGLFGLGYIGYVTFAVAYVEDAGATRTTVTALWFTLGAASVAATWFWARMDLGARKDWAFATALAGCSLGVLLLILEPSPWGAIASAAVFGACFLAVVSAVTQLARDTVASATWPAAIGRLTVVFGTGQILGPALSGLLSDTSTGLALGLGMSAAALLTATLAALRLGRTHQVPLA